MVAKRPAAQAENAMTCVRRDDMMVAERLAAQADVRKKRWWLRGQQRSAG